MSRFFTSTSLELGGESQRTFSNLPDSFAVVDNLSKRKHVFKEK